MVTIRCQNKVLGSKNGICGRVLAILTDAELDFLRIDPEGGPIHRCPQCPPDQRWSRITNIDGKIKFETIDQPTDLPPEVTFDEFDICEQVG